MWRLFFAIDFPQRIRERLAQAQEDLRRRLPHKIRWVNPAQIHLTLRFLGETPEPRVEGLVSAVVEALVDVAPFEVEVSDLGAFPDWRRPRVLWAGISEGAAVLSRVHDRIEGVVRAAGWPPEKPFSPHVTLGRVKRLQGRGDIPSDIPSDFGRCRITELILHRSILTPAGPEYTPVARIPLASPSP
ncbi:MAG: RNA 2',3'-cyclic phosphodiesterase [Deltaproteobacteria bacterium]|nr:MAG: RNA 2',3'-cyclic phosphodiesterase [Deltaproteobacteria bacterium]